MAINSMSDLLTRVKAEMLEYKFTSLQQVGTQIKKGVFAQKEIFPAIAILPVSEVNEPSRSGGQYKCSRTIQIEVWSHRYDAKKSYEMTQEILEACKDVLQASGKLDSDMFDIVYGDMTFGSEPPQKNAFLQRSIMPVTFRSFDTQPTDRKPLPAVELKECTAKRLGEVVFAGIKEHRNKLGKVKSFKLFVEPPMPGTRELAVLVNTESQPHMWGGRDAVVRNIELIYWTYMFGKEISLDQNLAVIETLKDICQTEFRWKGYALWSWVPKVDYGMYIDEGKFLYSSSMKLECMCKENL